MSIYRLPIRVHLGWQKEITPHAQRHISEKIASMRRQHLVVHHVSPGSGVTPATIRGSTGRLFHIDGNALTCTCQSRTKHFLPCSHLTAYFVQITKLQSPTSLVGAEYTRPAWLTGLEKAGASQPAFLNFEPQQLGEIPNDFSPPISWGSSRGRPAANQDPSQPKPKRVRRSKANTESWADFVRGEGLLQPGAELATQEEFARTDWGSLYHPPPISTISTSSELDSDCERDRGELTSEEGPADDDGGESSPAHVESLEEFDDNPEVPTDDEYHFEGSSGHPEGSNHDEQRFIELKDLEISPFDDLEWKVHELQYPTQLTSWTLIIIFSERNGAWNHVTLGPIQTPSFIVLKIFSQKQEIFLLVFLR
jgi:hypothetical protein